MAQALSRHVLLPIFEVMDIVGVNYVKRVTADRIVSMRTQCASTADTNRK